MAITKPTWTENQTLRSSATLAASGTDTNDIDLDTNGYDLVVVQFNITIGSSSGVTIEIFSSPDSGTTEDNESLAGGFTADADVIKTITVMGHPYIAVKITNNDGSNATGNIEILYAGRQWTTS